MAFLQALPGWVARLEAQRGEPLVVQLPRAPLDYQAELLQTLGVQWKVRDERRPVMAEVAAHELGKTHYCKHPGCTNEARSSVGVYSRCPEHQNPASVAASKGAARGNGGRPAGRNGSPGGAAQEQLAALIAQAKRVDKLKAQAEQLTRKALDAKRVADEAEREYRQALRAAVTGD